MGNEYVPVLYSHGAVPFITKICCFREALRNNTSHASVFCVCSTSDHVTEKK